VTYLVVAYVVAFALIGGYVVYLSRRVSGLSEDIEEIRRPQS
jgi:CcmD family protein